MAFVALALYPMFLGGCVAADPRIKVQQRNRGVNVLARHNLRVLTGTVQRYLAEL